MVDRYDIKQADNALTVGAAAIITAFTVPTGTQQRGQQVQTTVRVKNTSGTSRRFWVGLSYQHQNAQPWPDSRGWHDVMPLQTPVLSNGQEVNMTFTFTIPLFMQSGQWYGVAAVWDGYDSQRHLMIGIGPDNAPFDHSWNHSEWYDDGRGERAFSLVNEPMQSSFIDSLIYWAGTYYGYPTILADYMAATSKPLYFCGFNAQGNVDVFIPTPAGPIGPIPIHGEGSARFLIDLADLFGATPEGAGLCEFGGSQWVTCWIDLGGALGLAKDLKGNYIEPDSGILDFPLNFANRGLADFREYYTTGMKLTLGGWTIADVSFTPDGRKFQWMRFDGNKIQGLTFYADLDGLYAFEFNKGKLRTLLSDVVAAGSGDARKELANALSMKILGVLPRSPAEAESSPWFRAITYDDGNWPIYSAGSEYPINASHTRPLFPWNSGDWWKYDTPIGHYFYVSVPEGATRLTISLDGSSATGNADLFLRRFRDPHRVSPTLYDRASIGPSSSETITVENPAAGDWQVMVRAASVFSNVRFFTTIDYAGTPIVTIASTDAYASEPGLDVGRVRLSRSGATSASLTVGIGKSGTATHSVDYQALPNTVTFAAGQATVDLEIIPIDDTLVEGDETVIITVLPGSGYQVGDSSCATVVIADNDVADTQRPTAIANVSGITTAGGATHTFTVTYSDNAAINVGTLDSSDIRVTGPNGYSETATYVSVNPTGNGTPRTATYRINAPGGTWDYADNGTYFVMMRPNQVADISANFVLEGLLETFTVNIPGQGPVITPIPDATTPSPAGTPYTGPRPVVTGTPPITWSLINGPSGMTIDPGTGIVSWPTPGPAGSSHLVTIRATNAEGFSDVSWYLSVPQSETVDTPTFNPDGGTHSGSSVNVTITCETPNATIRYTSGSGITPGADPTASSTVVPANGIVNVPVPGWLKAKAWKAGMTESGVKTAVYQAASQLTINPPSRTHTAAAAAGQTITVTANLPWTATANASWITITSGSSGSGNGTVVYSVAKNI